MKKTLLTVFLITFSTLSSAALIHLEFSNGWEVDFDNNIISNTLEETTYGNPNIYNTSNDTIILNKSKTSFNNNNHIFVNYGVNFENATHKVTYYGYTVTRGNMIFTDNHYRNIDYFRNVDNITDGLISTLNIDDFFRVSSFFIDSNVMQLNDTYNITLESMSVDGVNIGISQVPVPGALLLFGSGLIGLIRVKKIV